MRPLEYQGKMKRKKYTENKKGQDKNYVYHDMDHERHGNGNGNGIGWELDPA